MGDGIIRVARDHAYGMLPAVRSDGVYSLPPSYVDTATRDTAVQLSKAGTRLALLLNGCWRLPEGWGIDPSRVGHEVRRASGDFCERLLLLRRDQFEGH